MALPPPSAITISGSGPTVILVHGSATDAGTWSIQLSTCRGLRLVAYHRRGTPAWPAPNLDALGTGDHLDDLADVVESYGGERPCLCGSSYGAVIVLELLRRRPRLDVTAILCEPPLLAPDGGMERFLNRFRTALAERGGEQAAEVFLRAVIGDDGFERLPKAWRARCIASWPQIASDVEALARTTIDFEPFAGLAQPLLLVAGSRSPRIYRFAIEELLRVVPRAQLEVIAEAGHMMHVDGARSFCRLLTDWVREQ